MLSSRQSRGNRMKEAYCGFQTQNSSRLLLWVGRSLNRLTIPAETFHLHIRRQRLHLFISLVLLNFSLPLFAFSPPFPFNVQSKHWKEAENLNFPSLCAGEKASASFCVDGQLRAEKAERVNWGFHLQGQQAFKPWTSLKTGWNIARVSQSLLGISARSYSLCKVLRLMYGSA